MSVADIAALFGASEGKDSVPDVPVEHLDYGYVSECTDAKELTAILRVLKSGKEGIFTQLEDHVEKRLLDVLAPEKRKQYLALKSEPAREEVVKAHQDVDAWLATFTGASDKTDDRQIVKPPASTGEEEWTPKEKEFAATREKTKGNEAFRANEVEKAIQHYTRSLELVPNNPIVLANRSQARLKAKQYDQAEKDATAAITADPTYVKAWIRRGAALMKRGRYGLAVADYDSAQRLDPANSQIKKNRDEALQKFREAEGEAAALPGPDAYQEYVAKEAARAGKRVTIVESDDDSETEEADAKQREETVKASASTAPAKKRVQIVESDDEDDGVVVPPKVPSAPVKTSAPATAPAKPATTSKRVAIVESDDSDDGAEVPQRALPPSAAPAPKPAAPAAKSTTTTATSKRVAIIESDDEDEGTIPSGPSSGTKVTAQPEAPPAPATKAVPAPASKAAPAPAATAKPSESAKAPAPAPVKATAQASAPAPASAPVPAAKVTVPTPAPAVPVKAATAPAPAVSSTAPSTAKSSGASVAAAAKQQQQKAKPTISGPQSHRVEVVTDSDSEEEQPMPVLPELPPLPPAPVPTSTAPTKAQIDAAVSSKTAGNTLYSAGKYADSVEAYTQSLGAVEQQPVVLSNRAMALIKLERFSQAAADCQLGIKLLGEIEASSVPLDAAIAPPAGVRTKLWHRLATCQRALRKFEDAIASLQQCLRLEPDNSRVMQDIAEITEQMEGKQESAGKRAVQTPPVPKPAPAATAAQTKPTSTSPVKPTSPAKPTASVPAPKPTVVELDAPASPSPVPAPSPPKRASPASSSAAADIAARAARIASSTPVSVPPPPKTGFDFERDCRALLKSPATLMEYVKGLKPASFRKLFKIQIDPDLISCFLASVGNAGALPSDAATATALRAFALALSGTPSFDMTVMMFTAADRAAASSVVQYVRAAGTPEEAADVARVFGV